MSTRTIAVDGSGLDGRLVWFEPGRIEVEKLNEAIEAAGLGRLLPKKGVAQAGLRAAFSALIDSADVKKRGSPVIISPLRQDILGFEAVQQVKGDTENTHEFLLSVVADDNGNVTIAKVGHGDHIGKMASFTNPTVRAGVEAVLTKEYQKQCLWYPTSMATACIARAMKALDGILYRRSGGIYFIPEMTGWKVDDLADLIDIAPGELSVVVTKFNLKPGDRSYNLVIKALQEEIEEGLKEIDEALAELGKQRPDGKATRLENLDAMEAKLSRYEEMLGVTLSDLHAAVGKVREAVEAREVMEVCA